MTDHPNRPPASPEPRGVSEQSKQEQLSESRKDSRGQYLTTNQGLRVSDTDNSLTAGLRGPTLLEDFHLREKMMHFDHERIPERVVHARGSGAYGYFQVYEPLTELTRARVFQDPSVKTPVFVRFSTVAGFRGSADTVRDVRGFSVKFYTEEGNWDLVGNNMPVFFIQDAVKFPDLVHAVKPEPHHQMPQASAAHDTFWDFISLMPETAHNVMWVLSDRALPRSYRMMEGFGVHTFRFVNAEGKARFVKFHWRPVLGTASLVWDEAQKIAGKDPDFNRRDLWEAIEKGDFPEYELGVQIVEEEDEHRFDFDLLDATKIIPENEVPVRIVGKMTLNRNPDNFFAETEQVAFHPGHVVPGIDFTNDPLLQGRLFSYLDTQLIRLGGPNFAQLPINRPVAPVHNNQREGYGQQTIHRGRVSYFPNSLGDGTPRPAPEAEGGYVHYAERVAGHKIRGRSPSFADHFTQPAMFWHSLTPPEQDHLVEAAQFELGKVEVFAIRERMVHEYLNRIDHSLAVRVAEGIGVEPPTEDASPAVTGRVPEVGVEARKRTDSIRTRKVAVLAADGVDDAGLSAVRQALTDAGATVEVISRFQKPLQGEGGEVKVDKSFMTTASVMYDAVFVPGGPASIDALKGQGDALHFLNESFKHGKAIGAAGEGVALLRAADLAGVDLSGPQGQPDLGVVTSDGAELVNLTQGFIAAVAQHRFWNRPKGQVPA
ncbi:catalase [Deinococcus sp. MIMF12]|uniref:Catalase n=1 Tax=Deinococcus rhizophilus TaxID=3049544 RepID=A0ABT7JFT8_9DEIO|nr:catalase [Deinococcus rhizophilus]MDL2343442.1 catalase [Deinococcus rhizophilus]